MHNADYKPFFTVVPKEKKNYPVFHIQILLFKKQINFSFCYVLYRLFYPFYYCKDLTFIQIYIKNLEYVGCSSEVATALARRQITWVLCFWTNHQTSKTDVLWLFCWLDQWIWETSF